jgi:hypothetical protein
MIISLMTQHILQTLACSTGHKFQAFSLSGVSLAYLDFAIETLKSYGVESLVIENHLLCRFIR